MSEWNAEEESRKPRNYIPLKFSNPAAVRRVALSASQRREERLYEYDVSYFLFFTFVAVFRASLTDSRRSLPGLKNGSFFGLTIVTAPVFGFRPS